jgi:hypothetical protein
MVTGGLLRQSMDGHLDVVAVEVWVRELLSHLVH